MELHWRNEQYSLPVLDKHGSFTYTLYRNLTMKEGKDVIDYCQPEEGVQIAEGTEARREQLARFCKALAHPARVQILHYLGTLDACMCGDIVEQIPLAQSTVSQHLKVLKEAGLIQGTIDGPRTSYCINRQALAVFKELVAQL